MHTLAFLHNPGFSGNCLPKDLRAIVASVRRNGYEPESDGCPAGHDADHRTILPRVEAAPSMSARRAASVAMARR
jgi:hypothetical protein